MKPVLLLFALSAQLIIAMNCERGPFCADLRPDTLIFFGTVVSTEKPGYSTLITFAVDEILWGLAKEVKTVRVYSVEQRLKIHEKLLVVGRRGKTGEVIMDACNGLLLKLSDPWVAELRKSFAKREPAILNLRVLTDPNYAGIEAAEVVVVGNGKRFTGTTGRDGSVKIEGLPPGNYTISAAKLGYSLEGGPVRVSVPPGACGDFIVPLKAAGKVRGRMLNHLGVPVANARGFDLLGWNPVENKRDSDISRTFDTNSVGEFLIEGVVPGKYYLGANVWSQNVAWGGSQFPRFFYPGTMNFNDATPIVVRDGGDSLDLAFQLPDFGSKRQLSVRVVGADGEPVPDTLIENAPSPQDGRPMAAIEEKKTNSDGIALFEIWAVAEYRITARWVGKGTFRLSRATTVAPGNDPVKITIELLKGLGR